MSTSTSTADKANIEQHPQQAILFLLLVAMAIVGLLVGILVMSSDRPVANAGGADGKLGGDFVLQSARGEIALADYRGKVVVLYFGFLSCPEVCPASMSMLQQTLGKLETSERQQLQPILISIDPARDTADDLAQFTQYYDPQILGVTGTADEINNVAADYGAYFKITENKLSEAQRDDYVFEHTSRYYIVNQRGELVDAMRHSTTANELAARIRTLL